ncbi:MAG: hypothetical protein NTW29_15520 [Bacteroidetes bacterium]|nr:hypothetical protein [Bacteroidota bacterium]
MTKHFALIVCSTALLAAGCGSGESKKSNNNPAPATEKNSGAANFNAEAAAAPGTVIAELNYTEKDDDVQKTGIRTTQLFEDSTQLVVTITKKANDEVYDLTSYTIPKAAAKGLKADLTPMNDGGDNLTTYTPNQFGAVSLVFVAGNGTADTKIVRTKSMRIFMNEKKTDETLDNGISFPVADFKTAEEWVKKLKTSFAN